MAVLLDQFIPHPDIRERRQITIRAPAALVMNVARNFDLQSIWMIHGIFWLRAKLLRARPRPTPRTGLVADMLTLGWGLLAEEPDRFFVAGASCQPWLADVVFSPIAPEQFAAYAEADKVKIAWTLEVETLGPALSRFASETRAVATDEQARVRFRRYWRIFGIGIVMIRRFLMPAIRRDAERLWRENPGGPGSDRADLSRVV